MEKNTFFLKLNELLTGILEESLKNPLSSFERIEVRNRAISAIGQIFSEQQNLSSHQNELIKMFDEIFSDLVLSSYFSFCALDKTAQITLRRVLELGVAIVFLWDLPHKFWGWKTFSLDLNFTEMVEHIKSKSYIDYVTHENTSFKSEALFNDKKAKEIYGQLSNVIHGKIDTFESNLPNRYQFSEVDLESNLSLTESVQSILMELWENRFPEIFVILRAKLPALILR